MSLLIGTVVASLVPSTLSGGIAVVASIMVALFVAAFVFLAVAPIVSETWTEQLAAPQDSSSADQSATNAD